MDKLRAILGVVSGLVVSVILVSCGLVASRLTGDSPPPHLVQALEGIAAARASSLSSIFDSYLVFGLIPTVLGLIFLSPLVLLYLLLCGILFRFFRPVRSPFDLPLAWLGGALSCALAAELVLQLTGWGMACRDGPGGLWCLIAAAVRRSDPVLMFFVFAASGVFAGVVNNSVAGRRR